MSGMMKLDLGPPDPARGVKARIEGPFMVNGMRVWRVRKVLPDGTVGPQEGPDCLSVDQAKNRAEDIIRGRHLVWFMGSEFVKKPL